MASFFPQKKSSNCYIHEQNYKSTRIYLLLFTLATAFNLAYLLANDDSYIRVSAFIPYLITKIGMYMCGWLPEDYYTDGWENMSFLDNSFFIAMLTVSVILTLLYLLAWRMSSKYRGGWLIFALVLAGLDTLSVFLLINTPMDLLITLSFHAFVIYKLIIGILAWRKLKALPSKKENPSVEENDFHETSNSPILRIADQEIKHRVLLQARAFDLDICYRRVKQTNELVINGNVYDEFIGALEPIHKVRCQNQWTLR